jgi:hypothetical protein
MRNERTIRRIPWRLVLLCGGTLLLFGAAAPASADSNFSRGFENELGRVLAHEAVLAGKAVLFQGVVHPYAHGRHYDTHRDDYYDDRRDRRHRRHHRHRVQRYVGHGDYYDGHRRPHRHKRHKKHHKRRHYRGHGCDGHY